MSVSNKNGSSSDNALVEGNHLGFSTKELSSIIKSFKEVSINRPFLRELLKIETKSETYLGDLIKYLNEAEQEDSTLLEDNLVQDEKIRFFLEIFCEVVSGEENSISKESDQILINFCNGIMSFLDKQETIMTAKQLNKEISSYEQELCQNDDKNTFLLLARSGAGKTAFAHCKTNKPFSIEFQRGKTPPWRIESGLNDPDKKIGHINSQTSAPQKYDLDNETILLDTPGIFENRGIYQQMYNAYVLSRAYDSSDNIQVVMVVPYNDIFGVNNRYAEFIRTIKRFHKIFLSKENDVSNFLEHHVTFLISQTPKVDDETGKSWLPGVLNRVVKEELLKIIENIKNVTIEEIEILSFVKDNMDSVQYFYSPRDSDDKDLCSGTNLGHPISFDFKPSFIESNLFLDQEAQTRIKYLCVHKLTSSLVDRVYEYFGSLYNHAVSGYSIDPRAALHSLEQSTKHASNIFSDQLKLDNNFCTKFGGSEFIDDRDIRVKAATQKKLDSISDFLEVSPIYTWNQIQVECITMSDASSIFKGDQPYFKPNELWGSKKWLGNMKGSGSVCAEWGEEVSFTYANGKAHAESHPKCIRLGRYNGEIETIKLNQNCDPSKVYHFYLMEFDDWTSDDSLGSFSIQNCHPKNQYDLYGDGGHYRVVAHMKKEYLHLDTDSQTVMSLINSLDDSTGINGVCQVNIHEL